MDNSFSNNLVAFAGGGQANATKLGTLTTGPTTFNRFTTVANVNDSALLPPASGGLSYVIKNASGNSMNVYPCSIAQGSNAIQAGGDSINALGVNAPYAVAAGTAIQFFCAVTGTWDTLL